MDANTFDMDLLQTLGPELTVFVGLLLIMIIPNLGNGKFRIPGTQIELPWFLGGTRYKAVSSPRLPGLLAVLTMSLALIQVLWYLLETNADGSRANAVANVISSENGYEIFSVNLFSRIFEAIFFAALLLAALASLDRLPTGSVKSNDIDVLFNNRRQADFYILMLTSALGMSVVALAQDMFVLFIGLELASFSTYVLVAFHKETRAGSEGGAKYFIVGSVASAVGLYGLSMLYLWAGSLQFDVLAAKWATDGASSLSMMALGFVLVGFAFKISAAPFHFAAPDAYSGANSPVAGVLATASKAMGMLGLMRVLLLITVPDSAAEDESAVWIGLLGVMAAVTMTWGNIAALGSENPKRMLAYSSVAHAGYMLAALTAIGAWNWGLVDTGGDAKDIVVAALLFHMFVLVFFKLGAFLVLGLLEMEGGASRLSSLSGLGKREPLLAVAMFLFMISLAGVPPMAGFLSKLLVIMGIVEVATGSGSLDSLMDAHWVWWLALLMVLNSAISMFYYLRVGVVMYFHEPEEGREGPLASGVSIRLAIAVCAIGTVAFGLVGGELIELCRDATQYLG
ncbi:MAG: NADH-quinone oxidoreductase subunit N [Candidatus Poseidoniaceae archaeon]|nr:NADH-quinone oxidoreductase subunit N [Candidatus Poseidoniaceae archaeon]